MTPRFTVRTPCTCIEIHIDQSTDNRTNFILPVLTYAYNELFTMVPINFLIRFHITILQYTCSISSHLLQNTWNSYIGSSKSTYAQESSFVGVLQLHQYIKMYIPMWQSTQKKGTLKKILSALNLGPNQCTLKKNWTKPAHFTEVFSKGVLKIHQYHIIFNYQDTLYVL